MQKYKLIIQLNDILKRIVGIDYPFFFVVLQAV